MRIVAWGFSSRAASEAFARELARLPGRNDLLLQIDPETRTIDFSSVRVTEFLRTDHGQVESLLRALDKDPSVTLVFDMWRFLLADGFEEALERVAKASARARRAVLLCPHRVSHVSALPLRGPADAGLARFVARTLALHERFLNGEGDVTLLCAPPMVEAFWGALGHTTLAPARRLGVSFAPRELRELPAAFTSGSVLARELCRLLEPTPSSASTTTSRPWVDAPTAVDVAWSDGVRAFDCAWERYVAAAAGKTVEPGPGTTSALPAYVTDANRASVARLLFAYGAWEKARVDATPATRAPGALDLLFPAPRG